MWSIIGGAAIAAREPAMDVLTLTGFLAVVVLLTCYANARHAPVFELGCALAGAVAAVYGVVQGAWPLGIVEGVWTAAALRRWWTHRGERGHRTRVKGRSHPTVVEAERPVAGPGPSESRLTRLFGTR